MSMLCQEQVNICLIPHIRQTLYLVWVKSFLIILLNMHERSKVETGKQKYISYLLFHRQICWCIDTIAKPTPNNIRMDRFSTNVWVNIGTCKIYTKYTTTCIWAKYWQTIFGIWRLVLLICIKRHRMHIHFDIPACIMYNVHML